MNKTWKYILYTLIGIFALIGLVFSVVFVGMRFKLFDVRGSIAGRNEFFGDNTTQTPAGKPVVCVSKEPTCDWNETPEWSAIKGGLEKDQAIIKRVANETGVDARMIAAVVVPEQTRFFTSNREIFKQYFEPLKILGSLTQFSLGVSGIKEETAKLIEQYANDPTSEFYPGDDIAALIAYPKGADHDPELYKRLTDDKNHYYSYLYTAIYIKEVQSQWQSAGVDISKNPAAVVTLFNIGFKKSVPKPAPRAGGAGITTGGKTYVYGTLGENFYASDELITVFPR